jgi:hypothetical protein
LVDGNGFYGSETMNRGLGRYGQLFDAFGTQGYFDLLPDGAVELINEIAWGGRRPRGPRQHDHHVRAYERHLRRMEYERQRELERLAKLERDRPVIDAAADKRARRQAKRLAHGSQGDRT